MRIEDYPTVRRIIANKEEFEMLLQLVMDDYNTRRVRLTEEGHPFWVVYYELVADSLQRRTVRVTTTGPAGNSLLEIVDEGTR